VIVHAIVFYFWLSASTQQPIAYSDIQAGARFFFARLAEIETKIGFTRRVLN
jgi:hypothetical protein